MAEWLRARGSGHGARGTGLGNYGAMVKKGRGGEREKGGRVLRCEM
jgi:hypothetical protein